MSLKAPAVVLGLGQPLAGDDAVGILVARLLQARGVPALASTDATVLLDRLAEGRRVVVVDAVVGGGAAGDVLRLHPEALVLPPAPASSHALGLSEVLELARVLHGDAAFRDVAIVGVVTGARPGLGKALSPEVLAALGRAAALAAVLRGAT